MNYLLLRIVGWMIVTLELALGPYLWSLLYPIQELYLAITGMIIIYGLTTYIAWLIIFRLPHYLFILDTIRKIQKLKDKDIQKIKAEDFWKGNI